MDMIDWLLAEVEAADIPKKTIAERAGLRNASALSRILHKHVKPRHHQLEAIAGAIGLTLAAYYESVRAPVGVRDAREALRVLTEFVDQRDSATRNAPATPRAKPNPEPNASAKAKRKVSRKSSRSHAVKPFHAAANPNAILLGDDDDED